RGDHRGGKQAAGEGEPEVRGAHGEKGGGGAVHSEPEERGMAERDHAGVADQDVGRHREQPPDQDLSGEALPKFGQDERSHREGGDHEAEARPVRDVRSLARRPRKDWGGDRAHFGVGTNRPVGRTRRVRIRTPKETITAWAGLTHTVASDSRRLVKMAARMDPPRFPMPPTTTTPKASSVTSN